MNVMISLLTVATVGVDHLGVLHVALVRCDSVAFDDPIEQVECCTHRNGVIKFFFGEAGCMDYLLV